MEKFSFLFLPSHGGHPSRQYNQSQRCSTSVISRELVCQRGCAVLLIKQEAKVAQFSSPFLSNLLGSMYSIYRHVLVGAPTRRTNKNQVIFFKYTRSKWKGKKKSPKCGNCHFERCWISPSLKKKKKKKEDQLGQSIDVAQELNFPCSRAK